LTAIGITAADLWSSEGILWMEGPSDQSIVAELVAVTPGLDDVSITVVPMPDWIRSAAGTSARAAATVSFCETVCSAVLPVKVESMFVFDGDERSEELRTAISVATANRARFLAVREIENLFLIPTVIHAVLAEVCAGAGRQPPTIEQVDADLNALLTNIEDRKLYRTAPAQPNKSNVVGSQVLDALWWKWALAAYDKVADGPRLMLTARAADPSFLDPMTTLVHELAQTIRSRRASAL
jgi:hypothetical protein